MRLPTALFLAIASLGCLTAAVHEHPPGKVIPHAQYIRTLSASEYPVEKVVVRSKDGTEVPAAIRKPVGAGPFPALVYFHGAPGGRGIDKLGSWALGETGSPVFERFVKEGYVVIIGDYRNPPDFRPETHIIKSDSISYIDDGEAVLNYARTLPYVDPRRIAVYGVSLGGNVVAHLITRTNVSAAVLGAPFISGFLGVRDMRRDGPIRPDASITKANVDRVNTPVLLLVGKLDGLIAMDRVFYDALTAGGKRIDMEVYENGYHDFCIGPQGHAGFNQPLMSSTLDALDLTIAYLKTAFAK